MLRWLLILLLLLTTPCRAEEIAVDLELVLAVDASGSVDETEYQLQMQGLAQALQSPAVLDAIAQGNLKRIAVVVVIWAEGNRPKEALPWALIDGADAAAAYGAFVMQAPRSLPNGGTGIGKALFFAAQQFEQNGFVAPRQVIDLSGDGRETAPADWSLGPEEGRAYARSKGVVINALAIENEDPELSDYYSRFVISGTGAFVMAASDYQSFAAALERKLMREISYRPPVS